MSPSLHQEFVQKARARLGLSGGYGKPFVYTKHSEYKMREYNLSRQKVEGIIRRPYRTETGIVPRTVAVMQPVSPKMVDGKTVWKQEIWALYQEQRTANGEPANISSLTKSDSGRQRASGDMMLGEWSTPLPARDSKKIISAWRYPGVSPAGNPIPANILRELEEGDILEEEWDNQ